VISLLYHNVLSTSGQGLPVAADQVSASAFRDHIRLLRHEVVHPTKVEEDWREGRRTTGTLITFDDGAAGILAAARILAEHGLAGVAFICPGAVQGGLWFYVLADALARTSAASLSFQGTPLAVKSAEEKRHAYGIVSSACFKLAPARRDAQLADLLSQAATDTSPAHPALSVASSAELEQAAATGGLWFANHSWSHPDLTALDDDTLAQEIDLASDWIRASGLPSLPWFAMPRGRYDDRVLDALRRRSLRPFGARPKGEASGVVPRIGLYRVDADPIRFRLKLAWYGRRLVL
jgi:peptidoglycan/xylan/chitin deacetylase (PgdA/CDA1 family)